MDAVVHTLPVPVTGSQERPSDVPGGSGGPAFADDAAAGPGALAWAGGATFLGAALLVGAATAVRRRVAAQP